MNRKTPALACLASALMLVACASDIPPEKAAQVIAQAKDAMGGDAWNDIELWYEEGEAIAQSGTVSSYTHWGDFRTLGVRNTNSSQSSFMLSDGKAAYRCADDACAERTAIDALAVKRGTYAASYGFFFPERFPASFEYLGVLSKDGVRCDVVRATPVDLAPIQIWVDQQTHLISRLVFENEKVRADLSEYRQVERLLIPLVTQESGMTMRTATVRFHPAGTVAFTPPAETPPAPAQ